jgi:nitrogen fixation/metabolism regulation signal transduction histidine kinase
VSPENPSRRSHRKALVVTLSITAVVLLVVVFSQTAFNLTFLRPDTTEQTLLFTALSLLVFLLLVALLFVLGRNLLKLYAERRGGVLGSKFRTKMVLGALLLSLGPVIFLFLFAYGLMNRSIDKWFSRPVEELREDSGQIATLLANYAGQNASAEAQTIAAAPEVQHAFQAGNFSGVINEMRQREATLQGGFALALLDDDAMASFHNPEPWGVLRSKLPDWKDFAAPHFHPFSLDGKEYMLGVAPVGEHGRVLVAMPLPPDYGATLHRIEASQQRYFELSQQRKLVRRTFMLILLLLALVVLFVSTYLALFLSKLVTRPVAALAEATQQISRGRLEYRVEVPATDELGQLVSSFNRMAEELEAGRRQIEASSHDLAGANVELEQRRRHMETILESIPTGVLSLDAERRVTHSNHAFARIFSPQAPSITMPRTASGSSLRDLFPEDVVSDLEHLVRKANRMGMTTSQMEILVQRAKLNVAVTVAALEHEGQRLGYVLVFEDLSDLLKAQKQAAWREVARRVAHEIKNPLTPIALSAERIRRHLERGAQPDPQSLAVINGCAETISGAVDTVRSLVDEFAALARFPTARPEPADINAIVESTLTMFNGRLDNIHVQTELSADLPRVMADAEAIKRALANLVDNAAEAMQDSLMRELRIGTALIGAHEAVEIVVADTGHGVTRELKEKLFLPYFSTKRRGTGLGLAIVSRIIEDHHGSIRVEENQPLGARFIVELPVAAESLAQPHPHDA